MLNSINDSSEFTRIIIRNLFIAGISVGFFIVQLSCGSSKLHRLEKSIGQKLNQESFSHHHLGFIIYDPVDTDTLFAQSSDRYFIPASNVKIFTLYTALKLIPEKLPVMKYVAKGDTLYFEGQADPAGLHPYFNDSTAIEFLSKYNTLYFNASNMSSADFGPGWAWEDYDRSYAPPRSSFPLYGNVLELSRIPAFNVRPEYFKDSVLTVESNIYRKKERNLFYYPPGSADSLKIPFKIRPDLSAVLMTKVLGKKIHSISALPQDKREIVSGMPRDSVLMRMMVESDNFLAEQMLLSASASLSDTLGSETAIRHMKEDVFSELDYPPRWVDGSGLSRYNLFAPESIVYVLELLIREYGESYVLKFFPVGGVSGTISQDFGNSPDPFVFAKSGSLGNVYCLSGYLRARSGRLLIFSFMNNNYRVENESVKAQMADVLLFIRDQY
jgi:D-alanyl-D-alanine carboxypeptidase/D-alanyl-D-alanine-endopeptidase (penicillin-binding protein 4)